MTRLEKVMTEKREVIRKLLLGDYCPSDFGVKDRHDGHDGLVEYCDPDTRDCAACWNEETEK